MGAAAAALHMLKWARSMRVLLRTAGILAAVHVSAASAATVSLNAIAVPAGATIALTATGLPPATGATVSLDAQQEDTVATDASGALTATLLVPAATTIGSHIVTVEAADGTSAQSRLAVEPPDAPTVTDATMATNGLGPLHFAVSVPQGAAGGTRYPVIYFLHGLPAGASSYQTWPVALNDRLGVESQRAIIVAPQAASTTDPDPEYLDLGVDREWTTALAVELPQYIDAHFPTIVDRTARAVIGVSAGGYGAIALGLQHLSTFSVVESWSGYFEPTTPDGRHALDLGSAIANARASMFTRIPRLNAIFARDPTFLGFYVGRRDALFVADNLAFHRRLRAAGVPHTWGLYPAGHSSSLWLDEAPLWVALALDHLVQAR